MSDGNGNLVVKIRRDKVSEMKAQKLVSKNKTIPRENNSLPRCPFCQGLSPPSKGDEDEGLSSRLAKKQLETVSDYARDMFGKEGEGGPEGRKGTLVGTCPACVAIVKKVWDLHLEIVEIKGEIQRFVEKLFQKCKETAPLTSTPSPVKRRGSPRVLDPGHHIEVVVKDEVESCHEDDDEHGHFEDLIAISPNDLGGSPVDLDPGDFLTDDGVVEDPYYSPEEMEMGQSLSYKFNSPQKQLSNRPQRKSRTKAEALLKTVTVTATDEEEDQEVVDTASNNDDNDINLFQTDDEDEEFFRNKRRRVTCRSDISKVLSSTDSWQCSKCSKVFEGQKNARRHVWWNHGKQAFKHRKKHTCPHCKNPYRSISLLNAHILAIHTEGFLGFPCSKCGRVSKYLSNLKKHEAFCLAKAGEATTNVEKVKKIDGRSTASKYNPEEFGLLPEGEFWKCSECTHVAKYVREGMIHVRRVHRKEKGFTCDQCGYSCFTFSEMKKHNQKHHGEEGAFPCRKCGHILLTARDRIIHEVIACRAKHTKTTLDKMKIKILTCEKEGCGFQSAYEKQMDRHSIVHTGSRDFNCDECGKAFKYQKTLREHERRDHGKDTDTTTGSKFICLFCQASFKTKGDLRVHQVRAHPEELTRDFICGECESSFLTAGQLRYHHKVVHEPKPECKKCGREIRHAMLKKHEDKCSSERGREDDNEPESDDREKESAQEDGNSFSVEDL